MTVDHHNPWVVVTVGDYLAMPVTIQQEFTAWVEDMGVDMTWCAQVGIGSNWVAVDTLVRHPCGWIVQSAGVPHVTRKVIMDTPQPPGPLRRYLVWTETTDYQLGEGRDD